MSLCNICGADNSKYLFKVNNFRIDRCRNCGLVYAADPPDSGQLKEYYGRDYYSGNDPRLYKDYLAEREPRLAEFRERLKNILVFSPRGRLLDVGCAAGFFLEAARSYFDVTGVEHSEWSSKYGKETLGLNIFTGQIKDAVFPDNNFDVVTLWDTIEHLHDPKRTLLEINRVIKINGLLVITTADINSVTARFYGRRWIILVPPWHLYYFSSRTIKTLLGSAGFVIKRIDRSGIPFLNENRPSTFFSKLIIRLFCNRYANKIIPKMKLGAAMTIYATKDRAVDIYLPNNVRL